MLEQQQNQLVSGLQEMYRRSLAGQPWQGKALSESTGHPLTHDILAALDLLETKHDGTGDLENFEDDCEKLQSRLVADGAIYVRRRGGSFSSDSDHSQHGLGRSSTQSTPSIAKPLIFKENFSFSATSSPLAQSPAPRQRLSYPPAHESPLHQSSALANDPQLYQADWSVSELSNPEDMLRSRFALQAPQLQSNLDEVNNMLDAGQWDDSPASYGFGMSDLTSCTQQRYNPYDGLSTMPMYGDPIDMDFSRFIQVVT